MKGRRISILANYGLDNKEAIKQLLYSAKGAGEKSELQIT